MMKVKEERNVVFVSLVIVMLYFYLVGMFALAQLVPLA